MERAIAVAAVFVAASATSEHTHAVSRRTSVRAVLANKMDPNFWPSRGRRSGHDDLSRRQTTDEDGPFWANRGRSLFALDSLQNQLDNDDKPFWANRGRAAEEEGPFWANRGRAVEDGPFWANRGRSLEDGPFWANRGRAVEDGPLWANRGREVEEGPFWANRGREVEDGPFWANRGRSTEKEVTKNKEGLIQTDLDKRQDELEGLRQDKLFVEEPGWLDVTPGVHTNVRRTLISDSEVPNHEDTFWVSRGKKSARLEPDLTPGRLNAYWIVRTQRDNKLTRALEKAKGADFWASRGKRDKSLHARTDHDTGKHDVQA